MSQMHNNLRDEKVSDFETTLANIRYVGVNSFLEQFPEEKEPLKKFKKDVETYKYASDEHIFTHDDKAVGEIKIERRDAILFSLEKRDFRLRQKIEIAYKKKQQAVREEEKRKAAEKKAKTEEKKRQRSLKMIGEWLAEGMITQERHDEMAHPDFDWGL
jgi:hypothetical protein